MGGFVGVDIFFVISGYLITLGIVVDIEQGRFSFTGFYDRRIRRIFPALFGLLVFTTIAACAVLLPSEFRAFTPTLIGTLLFVSNIVFFNQAGYFDESARDKPLLHTWSLGLEEQFYLFAPLLILFSLKRWRHGGRYIIVLVAGVSFLLCVFCTSLFPTAAFYLTPFRAWEFFGGSMIAMDMMPTARSSAEREILAGAGLALIGIAIKQLTTYSSFPGSSALLPVAGTALIIAYGENTLVGRMLSLRPLAFIGLISYSLYLWHWPLIVFAHDLGWKSGAFVPAAGLITLSISAAYLSWRHIEQPFRDRAKVPRSKIFDYSIAASGVMLMLAAILSAMNGWPARYAPSTVALDRAQWDFSSKRDQCLIRKGDPAPGRFCTFGVGQPTVAVWADSHGLELADALGSEKRPVQAMTYIACPPVIGYNLAAHPRCKSHNERVLTYLDHTPRLSTVIMTAYYARSINAPDFPNELTQTIDDLRRNHKKVVLIGPVPAEGSENLPKLLARHREPSIPESVYISHNFKTINLLANLQRKGTRVIWPSDYLCHNGVCDTMVNGNPVLFDSHHLSMSGARFLVAKTQI